MIKRISRVVTPVRRAGFVVLVAAGAVLAGCATSSHLAPVEDRMPRPVSNGSAPVVTASTSGLANGPATPSAAAVPAASASAPAGAASAAEPILPRPGSEFAGQPGYYTVKVGDTLVRIGLETGQNWRDIARWNNIDNPNVIKLGDTLRLAAPATNVVVPAPGAQPKPGEPVATPLIIAPAPVSAAGYVRSGRDHAAPASLRRSSGGKSMRAT